MSAIRQLTAADIPQALGLVRLAGWNQTEADWARLLRLAPETCWCTDDAGMIVSTTTVVRYGDLAWVGMVLTHPEHRGRGFARLLMRHALGYCDEIGIVTVKLDATELGRPLYSELGFEEEQAAERWVREGVPPSDAALHGTSATWRQAETLDRAAFGASRVELLSELAADGTAFGDAQGAAFVRRGRLANHLGPCVAESFAAAGRLVQATLLRTGDGRCLWDLLPENLEATQLAEQFGFHRQRELVRMRRGPRMKTDSQLIYATAGFELG